MTDNVIRPQRFAETAAEMERKERFEGYVARRNTDTARRVVEMLRAEGLLVAVPVPVHTNEGVTP